MNTATATLLLVDDDEIDSQCVIRSFRKAKIANPITRAHDGIEALDILRGTAQISPLKKPYLVLLDINMPRMNGLEFLSEIRKDENLQDAVVFMLTTSENHNDIASAYDQHVAGYIVKQNAGDDFVQLVNLLDKYWQVVVMPNDT